MAEIPLSLACFLGQDVAKVLFLVLYLARSGKRIALGCAFLGFHLRHGAIPLSYFLDLGLNTIDMKRPSIAGGLSMT